MKLLFTIPHFFNPEASAKHASQRRDPKPRIVALTACISALHQLFGRSQHMIDISRRVAVPANQPPMHEIDIRICTTQEHHVLSQVPLPPGLYTHQPTKAEPMLLGFECQTVLRDCLGGYDYYCFLEDDLILHDPWFFIKLGWFTSKCGDDCLLQPNRYEVSVQGATHKVYVDGPLALRVTASFQNVQEQPELSGKVMETPIIFRRALNPHSGCYFLNARQMAHWVRQPYFLDRDTSFVGPLESAATLGIMRTFKVYKTTSPHAHFLEIQHFGTGFLGLIGRQIPIENA